MNPNFEADPTAQAHASPRRSARLRSTGVACFAFSFTVLASVAAAAAVVSHDVPLMLGGL